MTYPLIFKGICSGGNQNHERGAEGRRCVGTEVGEDGNTSRCVSHRMRCRTAVSTVPESRGATSTLPIYAETYYTTKGERLREN